MAQVRRRTARIRRISSDDDLSPVDISESSEQVTKVPQKSFFPKFLLLLVIVVLGFLLFKNKDLLVAGTVNGKPILVWELQSKLTSRYGKQVLEEMMNERLVLEEAAKKGIKVSEKEIEDKVKEAEKSLAGQVTLAQALEQQGLTIVEFRRQMELRILVEKLLGEKAKVTSKEIDQYLSSNKENVEVAVGSDSAKQRQYAQESLVRQKIGAEFEKWFADLKTKAKVSIFLR